MQNTPLQNIAAVPSATVSSYAPAPAVTMTAAQSEVAALEARRAAAIAARDFTALEGVLADDYLHVYGGGNSSDRAGYIAQVRAAARVPTRGPLTVRSYGDSAIITGDLLNRINYPEGERVLDTFVTQVVHKVDGQWKFVSFQITPKAH
jgi:ketosteroid isomerase-like protein